MPGKSNIGDLEKEIADLEYRLHNARTRLALASEPLESGESSSYLPLPAGE